MSKKHVEYDIHVSFDNPDAPEISNEEAEERLKSAVKDFFTEEILREGGANLGDLTVTVVADVTDVG